MAWSEPTIDIPEEHLSAARGTYCQSRKEHAELSSADSSHPVNLWVEKFNNVEIMNAILRDCASIIARTAEGNLTIVSGLRPCGPSKHGCQMGNSLKYISIGSMPSEDLLRRFIGFLPSTVHYSAYESFLRSIKPELGPQYGESNSNLYRNDTVIPCILPVPFGHRVEDGMGESELKSKLGNFHPFYSDWIEATNWMIHSDIFQGSSLQEFQNFKLPQQCNAVSLSKTVYSRFDGVSSQCSLFNQIYTLPLRLRNHWLLLSNTKVCLLFTQMTMVL